MSTLAVGRRAATRGTAPVPAGRIFQITPAADVWVFVGSAPAGEAQNGDFHFALYRAGVTYSVQVPATGGPFFFSGTTTDPNGDITPVQITYADVGASGV